MNRYMITTERTPSRRPWYGGVNKMRVVGMEITDNEREMTVFVEK